MRDYRACDFESSSRKERSTASMRSVILSTRCISFEVSESNRDSKSVNIASTSAPRLDAERDNLGFMALQLVLTLTGFSIVARLSFQASGTKMREKR